VNTHSHADFSKDLIFHVNRAVPTGQISRFVFSDIPALPRAVESRLFAFIDIRGSFLHFFEGIGRDFGCAVILPGAALQQMRSSNP
jgi:hypothetical protein